MRHSRRGLMHVALLAGLLLSAGAPAARCESFGDPATLKAAVNHLATQFGARYPGANGYLARLTEIERQWNSADPSVAKQAKAAFAALQREALMANPLVRKQPILFVVREQYLSDHHNTATLFHTGEPNCSKYRPGGALKIFDPQTGKVSLLFDPGPEGLLRDPEVHFDGRRVVFAMRAARDENYSIYELQVDPLNGYAAVPDSLRRLTAEPGATDIDPLYLPDGKIAFTSTREPKYCHCNMHIMANLYRMDADGANIHQIGKSTLFEGHGSLLPDGRILYYRWEYVDRNFGDAQGLWTVNPDGTNHAVHWGNNTVSPAAVFDGRIIPGTNKVVCIFGSCHDRPWGSLAILDHSKGIDSEGAVERIWPKSARSLISITGADLPRPFMCDQFKQLKCRYEDPYPLADDATQTGGTFFLVSRNVPPAESAPATAKKWDLNDVPMGVYLVDTFGNEVLLHAEQPGCFDPMPIAPHPRPVVLPDRRDYESQTGLMYVTDVYNGNAMEGVHRGDVAALRVVESVEKRFWTGPLWRSVQYKQGKNSAGTLNRPAVSWAGFEVKKVLGTVPVEADGSAYFEVPAEKFVYFQLLDREGMLIATMRSGTTVQPGERFSCVGCHENRLGTPPPREMTLALRNPPRKLDGWHGSSRSFNYAREVQPIWDKHCVSCHDFGKEAGAKLILAGDKELVFNASYVELFQKWGEEDALLNTVGNGLAATIPAYSVGSPRSRLIELLKRGHEEVQLSADEMDRIITWIDIGAPYYPDYGCAYPQNVAGRAPLTIPQVRRLEELTGITVLDRSGNPGWNMHRLWISFDRPELSPCLRKLDKAGDAYKEALAMIRAGGEQLRKIPEADMPGFHYCAEHQAVEDKYRQLRERERERRAALVTGKKVYDGGIGPSSK